MFKVNDSVEIINQIDKALKNELVEILPILPDLKNEIIKNMMWGMFFNEKGYALKGENKILNIPYSLIEDAKNVLPTIPNINKSFFPSDIEEKLKGNNSTVTLIYEEIETHAFLNKEMLVDRESFKDVEIIISLTYPDSEFVVKSLIEGELYSNNGGNDWLFEYMDQYDDWRYKLMDKMYRYEYQIGGHGRWIQSDYNNRYVAQVNNGIGDSGSVFVFFDNSGIRSWVDMG
jgi:hypothetical protein